MSTARNMLINTKLLTVNLIYHRSDVLYYWSHLFHQDSQDVHHTLYLWEHTLKSLDRAIRQGNSLGYLGLKV